MQTQPSCFLNAHEKRNIGNKSSWKYASFASYGESVTQQPLVKTRATAMPTQKHERWRRAQRHGRWRPNSKIRALATQLKQTNGRDANSKKRAVVTPAQRHQRWWLR